MYLYHDKGSHSTEEEQSKLLPEQLPLFPNVFANALFSSIYRGNGVQCVQQSKAPPVAGTTGEADQPHVVAHVRADAASIVQHPRGERQIGTMEARQIKGLRIAALSHIEQQGKSWIVPSQSSNKKYIVRYGRRERTCTCSDFESRRQPCKHIYAVAAKLDPQPVTEIPALPRKPTYKQEWREYNLAQTNEKAKFLELLFELCKDIEDLPRKRGAGRTRLPLSEMIFCAVYKVYSLVSGRRFMCDLKEAFCRSYISRIPHFNSIFNYLELEAMTDCLTSLITRSSLPLKAIEQDFAVDSSGFSTGIATRWFLAKYTDNPDARMIGWLKVHIMTGVLTHIVTSVEISGRHSNDTLYFKPLVDATAQNFKLREVSADKAYSSAANLRHVVAKDAVPYIPFKENSLAHHKSDKSGVWHRLWHYYNYNHTEFMMHYHKRSNVETTFSMIKGKFGERLRSKTHTSQVNEILCKVLCHNLCCVVQSIYELGVEANYTIPSRQWY